MQDMKASAFYRIAAALLLLFDIGHTLDFRQSDPKWGVDALLASMQSIHFDVQGPSRTYWDLFVVAGFFVPCFFYSQRCSRGSSADFRQRRWATCAPLRGRLPFVLSA